eukprot:1766-Heterococcus_DN1.PRE.8
MPPWCHDSGNDVMQQYATALDDLPAVSSVCSQQPLESQSLVHTVSSLVCSHMLYKCHAHMNAVVPDVITDKGHAVN